MNSEAVLSFMSGAITMGYTAVAFCFLSSWWRGRNALIGLFAVAFFLLAIERVLYFFIPSENEYQPLVYLIRLSAFSLIILGIAVQNRRQR